MEGEMHPIGGGGGGGEKPEFGEKARDWSDLTAVYLVNVFHRLDLVDRWKGVMLVGRSWLDAARDPCLFFSFDLEPSFDVVASASGRPDSAAWWALAFERRVDSMPRSGTDPIGSPFSGP